MAKTSQADFAAAATEAVDRGLRRQFWRTFETYALVPIPDEQGQLVGRCVIAPKFRREGEGELVPNEVAHEYSPLHLSAMFLDFARLVQNENMDVADLCLRYDGLEGFGTLPGGLNTDKNAAVALRWAESYGVLGLTPHRRVGTWWPDDRGGAGDSIARFTYEAWVAHVVLRLYESATAPGGPDVEIIRRHLGYRRFRTQRAAYDAAFSVIERQVGSRLERFAFPRFYRRKDGKRQRGEGFQNLLGALYVQMLWLTDASSEPIRRCPWCNKVIVIEPGIPPAEPGLKRNVRGKYSTRADKTFCDRDCKAAFHYYHRKRKRLE